MILGKRRFLWRIFPFLLYILALFLCFRWIKRVDSFGQHTRTSSNIQSQLGSIKSKETFETGLPTPILFGSENTSIPNLTLHPKPVLVAPKTHNFVYNVFYELVSWMGFQTNMNLALDSEYRYSNHIAKSMAQMILSYPHMEQARANAVIFVLCRNSELQGILSSMKDFEWMVNDVYHYPYVFVNDVEFTDEFKTQVTAATASKVEFGLIPKEHWSLPDDIDPSKFQESLKAHKNDYMYGASQSYRFMCRYNSRFFYKHPLVQQYRYYWRMEPGVQYKCKMRYDPLLYMALTGKKYGYAIVSQEYLKTVKGLWSTTMEYMKQASLPMTDFMREAFYDPTTNDYNGNHFWSNFEIADFAFYRSNLYEGYMKALDDSHGFFMERYGDAPVHSIAVGMLLDPRETHYFSDISYYHDWPGSCPNIHSPEFSQLKTLCHCRRDYTWVDGVFLLPWGMKNAKILEATNKYSY